jgi:anti-sigma B factor antagonist
VLEGLLEPETKAKAPAKKAATKAPAKATKAKAKAPTGPLKIVIDLEGCEYIDSSGLGFFIGSLKKIKEQKGDLKLAHLNAYMMGIFKLINMHYIIEIHENLEKAIKSFGSPRRASASGRAYKE